MVIWFVYEPTSLMVQKLELYQDIICFKLSVAIMYASDKNIFSKAKCGILVLTLDECPYPWKQG